LKPKGVDAISSRLSELGFKVNLADLDEELAATVIEVLTLHREGIPLEEVDGSKMVVKAVDLLNASKTTPNKLTGANAGG
jgi:hypothetical protein